MGTQSDWWAGDFPVDQPYGATSYQGEPAGHGYAHWHAGIDFGVPCGTQILAALPGTVTTIPVASSGGYGNLIKFRPSVSPYDAYDILLAHNEQFLVQSGAVVQAGTPLALSDSTGNSTGCHVHFEVRPAGGAYGSDVDPAALLLPGGGSLPSVTGTTLMNQSSGNPLDLLSAVQGAGTAIQQFGQGLEGEAEVAAGGLLLVVALGIALLGLLWDELPMGEILKALPGGAALGAAAKAARRTAPQVQRPGRAARQLAGEQARARLSRARQSQGRPGRRPAPRPAPGLPAPSSAPPERVSAPQPAFSTEQRRRVRQALRSMGFSPGDSDIGTGYAFRPGTAGDDRERLTQALQRLGRLRAGEA